MTYPNVCVAVVTAQGHANFRPGVGVTAPVPDCSSNSSGVVYGAGYSLQEPFKVAFARRAAVGRRTASSW
eukprot:366029-Chlamydomonas_euryale.AAC.48